jgi:hypothetical protein
VKAAHAISFVFGVVVDLIVGATTLVILLAGEHAAKPRK